MPSQQNTLRLVPPLNFACVEEGLFRSACPYALNVPFLQELQLDTVIWMASEDPSSDLLTFVKEKNVRLYRFGMSELTVLWEPEVEESILGALQIIADKTNGRILICCTMGRHRTGTVLGCLRRIQNWSLASTFAEYRRFTGSHRYRVINELHIETFDKKSMLLPEIGIRQEWLKDITTDCPI